MSDLFSRLAEHALDWTPAVQPRLRSRFEQPTPLVPPDELRPDRPTNAVPEDDTPPAPAPRRGRTPAGRDLDGHRRSEPIASGGEALSRPGLAPASAPQHGASLDAALALPSEPLIDRDAAGLGAFATGLARTAAPPPRPAPAAVAAPRNEPAATPTTEPAPEARPRAQAIPRTSAGPRPAGHAPVPGGAGTRVGVQRAVVPSRPSRAGAAKAETEAEAAVAAAPRGPVEPRRAPDRGAGAEPPGRSTSPRAAAPRMAAPSEPVLRYEVAPGTAVAGFEPGAPTPPPVEVRIGRIDIRAVPQETPRRGTAPGPRRIVGLEEYLDGRSGEGGRR
jgi:hypothetical protein